MPGMCVHISMAHLRHYYLTSYNIVAYYSGNPQGPSHISDLFQIHLEQTSPIYKLQFISYFKDIYLSTSINWCLYLNTFWISPKIISITKLWYSQNKYSIHTILLWIVILHSNLHTKSVTYHISHHINQNFTHRHIYSNWMAYLEF
jgi:hypothetical protein